MHSILQHFPAQLTIRFLLVISQLAGLSLAVLAKQIFYIVFQAVSFVTTLAVSLLRMNGILNMKGGAIVHCFYIVITLLVDLPTLLYLCEWSLCFDSEENVRCKIENGHKYCKFRDQFNTRERWHLCNVTKQEFDLYIASLSANFFAFLLVLALACWGTRQSERIHVSQQEMSLVGSESWHVRLKSTII